MAAPTGGGLKVRPGEVSLAHLGVLFLDELPEFQRPVLDSLRQPLETGQVDVARANAHVTFPARVQPVAAMNPCRCGYAGDPARNCNKYPRCIGDYQARLSGPLFDRIDLHVHVGAVSALDMTLPPPAEGSAEVAARVAAARARQVLRGVRSNAELEGERLKTHATPDEAGRKLLLQAAEKLRLSRARLYKNAAGGAHDRRSGGLRDSRPRPCCRGAILSADDGLKAAFETAHLLTRAADQGRIGDFGRSFSSGSRSAARACRAARWRAPAQGAEPWHRAGHRGADSGAAADARRADCGRGGWR
jgi:hypothetical protein